MAEENTVTMTVENIDRLFSEIVVNGESHISENYVPPVQLEQSVPQTVEDEEESQNNTPAQTTQGQDVYAVELNSVLHDLSDRALTQTVSTIQSKIPNQASSENKLADKNFVNSSIATNTANFLGTYTTLQEIEAIPNPTNNDYAYWDTTDSAGNVVYKRYKYNGESNEWLYEYDLNNSSFTAEQWATINSGLTQQSVDEDIQEAISQVGSGIEVYDTEEEMEEDLPNKQDDDLVGTLSSDDGELQDAPLGSVMSYLGTTDPTDGKWLICDGRDTTGTAIELETHYPSLYMFLGGTNVLPEIFDHSRPSAWETKTISTNSVSPTVMDYDGILFIQASRSGSSVGCRVELFINGTSYKSNIDTSSYNIWTAFVTAPVKKGDSVYYTYMGDTLDKCGGWFYKSHKIIKATSSVDYYHAPASEIAQIEQYFDNGIDTIKNNGLSYSTTETWTGGTWIDGKPIYKRVFVCTTQKSFNEREWTVLSNTNFPNITDLLVADTIVSANARIANNGYVLNAFILDVKTNNQVRFDGMIANTFAVGSSIIVEYTKTTD